MVRHEHEGVQEEAALVAVAQKAFDHQFRNRGLLEKATPFVSVRGVRAEARTYLRSNGNGNNEAAATPTIM
ncbi:MAG: hypothetical protein M3O02_11875 [Acidobacteriota bacterium]|nr:hypothetical protein [Acidobacteriota bacterium]